MFNTQSFVVWHLLYSFNTTSIWRHEHVVILLKTQQTSKWNINSVKINFNDIVLIYDKKVPRHIWRIDIVSNKDYAPLAYVYPNIIKTFLTLNPLLFDIYYILSTQHQYVDMNM